MTDDEAQAMAQAFLAHESELESIASVGAQFNYTEDHPFVIEHRRLKEFLRTAPQEDIHHVNEFYHELITEEDEE